VVAQLLGEGSLRVQLPPQLGVFGPELFKQALGLGGLAGEALTSLVLDALGRPSRGADFGGQAALPLSLLPLFLLGGADGVLEDAPLCDPVAFGLADHAVTLFRMSNDARFEVEHAAAPPELAFFGAPNNFTELGGGFFSGALAVLEALPGSA
jgi:hypothetical protein